MSVNSVRPIASCFLRKITPRNLKGLEYIQTPPKKDFFCKQIWDDTVKELSRGQRKKKTCVTYHGELTSFSHMLNGTGRPETMNFERVLSSRYPDVTVREAIFDTDIEFKLLEPLKEPMTMYRCIPRRPKSECYIRENQLFEKAINLKPGDKIMMREYAYFTPNKDYAMHYLSKNDGGILIEEHFPAGAKISQLIDEAALPRNSVSKCIDNTPGKIQHLKLEYVLPEELFG